MRPAKLISGGQTGADRAGLDVAIHLGIPWGGWAPREWLSEDREIPLRYRHTGADYPNGLLPPYGQGDQPMPGEMTFAAAYRERTELNVEACDAALLFYWDEITPGTKLTQRLLREGGKTFTRLGIADGVLHIRDDKGTREGTQLKPFTGRIGHVRNFIDEHAAEGKTLLVAGSRESKAPGIYAYIYTILREALR